MYFPHCLDIDIRALVQVEQGFHEWRMWQAYDEEPVGRAWLQVDYGKCCKNLGNDEQFVVWVNGSEPSKGGIQR